MPYVFYGTYLFKLVDISIAYRLRKPNQIGAVYFSDRNKRITFCCNIYNCERYHYSGTFTHTNTCLFPNVEVFSCQHIQEALSDFRLLLQWNLTQNDCFSNQGRFIWNSWSSASVCFADGLCETAAITWHNGGTW